MLVKDKAAHDYIERRFPKVLSIADRALGGLFDLVNKNAFGVILALLFGVLAITGLIDKIVASSIILAWVISVLWIARSNSIKRLSILSRLIVVIFTGVLFGLVGRAFGNYALSEYYRQQARQIVTITSPPAIPTPQPTSIPTPTPTPTPMPSPSPFVKPRSKRSSAAERRHRQELLRELEGRNPPQ